jgi:protein-S-isoprenylcysteine O-methyltransferase Ste14
MPPTLDQRPDKAALAFDLMERGAHAIFFGVMTWTLLKAWWNSGNPGNLILLISEGSAIVFILIRRFTSEISIRPIEWMIALGGTLTPLLARPAESGGSASALVILLMLAGFSLQVAAKFTLRRSFGVVPANRGVKMGGPYRLVRHPMYAGYLMTQVGFLITHPSIWNVTIYAIAFACQVSRIFAEERLLSRDPAYREFIATVRYRLAPGIF